VRHQPDTTIKDYTSYDTVLPKDYYADTGHHFTDTVHHIAQDTTHHENTDALKYAREKAELEKLWIKNQVTKLASHVMYGRGYVKGGRDSAAKYIIKKFKEFKLQPVDKNGTCAQGFAFPVNTFPGRMYLAIDKDSLEPGVDFLIDPASPSYRAEKMKISVIDLDEIKDTAAWNQKLLTINEEHAWCFQHMDSFCSEVLHIRKSQFAALLPKGVYIIPEEHKLTWSVSRETIAATVFYVDNDRLQKKMKKLSVDVNAVFIQRCRSENIIAAVPGAVKDSYIVFTAHYDHLGMMGEDTYFPGASDNASGTAMLLYLAGYFSKHPQHYSILFIAFAGEEASLMGSEFYVSHPFVPLGNIKFLTNIDIMGDATDGVTVVNATEYPKQFDLLKQLNDKSKYLPVINSRGKAANSDHYYFTEAGVPSFFIYSDGGAGHYHDVFDYASELTLNHVDDFAHLMVEFAKALR
jgi:aminopeptidase YwaD